MSKRSSKKRSKPKKSRKKKAVSSPPSQEATPETVVAESEELADDDFELDLEGIDLTDPRNTRLEDFDVAPRATEDERPTVHDNFATSEKTKGELAPNVEIPPEQDKEEGGLVDFLETPTLPKARRVQFLPEDHLAQPRYMPDDLSDDEGAGTTSTEQSPVWGKQHVDTPTFDKFDDSEAIKEGIRSVPVLGKTLLSPTLMFRNRFWKWTALGASAAVFGWGLYGIQQWIRANEISGAAPQAKAALGLYEPATIRSIDELLDRYFQATTIEERLPFIRAASQVAPLMRAHEEEFGPESYTGYERDAIKAPAPYLDTAFFTVDVVLEPSFEKRRLVIQRTEEGSYLLDWENLVGFQAMSWKRLMESLPTEPQAFQAVILPSDYYNYHFSDRKKWASWCIRHPANPELVLYGYTPRNSPMTQDFERSTMTRVDAPDQGTAVTIKLAYPENATEASQVEILEVVKRGWITSYE